MKHPTWCSEKHGKSVNFRLPGPQDLRAPSEKEFIMLHVVRGEDGNGIAFRLGWEITGRGQAAGKI